MMLLVKVPAVTKLCVHLIGLPWIVLPLMCVTLVVTGRECSWSTLHGKLAAARKVIKESKLRTMILVLYRFLFYLTAHARQFVREPHSGCVRAAGYAIHTQRVFDFLRHDFPKPT